METRAAQLYFILGTPGSGRREIVADLVANGLGTDDRAVLVTPPGDGGEIEGVAHSTWNWTGGAIEFVLPEGVSHVFLFADPFRSPVDQTEALVAWLPESGAKLARVFTVVDCALGHANPPMFPWFEACVHFSDVVFFTNRSGIPGSWIAEFEKHFKKRYYPCLFEKPDKGEVSNPALVLENMALRMSPAFEDEFSLATVDYEIEGDDEDEDDDNFVEEEERMEDPYFARNRGGGNRVIEVPDIRPFLKPKT